MELALSLPIIRAIVATIVVACVAQEANSLQVPTHEEVIQASARILQWYLYWHPRQPGSPSYRVGSTGSVLEVRSAKVAGLCTINFGLCIGFRVGQAGRLFSLGPWAIPRSVSGEPSLIDFLKTNIASAWPAEAPQPAHARRPPGRASVDGTRLAPIGSEAPNMDDLVVDEAREILPAVPPLDTLPPASIGSLSGVVRKELLRYFSTPDCPVGSAKIPQFSDQDPFVYVLADFGKCGRGILILKSSVDGSWRFSQFVMAKEDIEWFSRRILKRPLLVLSVRPHDGQ